jgi:hypothetical protein
VEEQSKKDYRLVSCSELTVRDRKGDCKETLLPELGKRKCSVGLYFCLVFDRTLLLLRVELISACETELKEASSKGKASIYGRASEVSIRDYQMSR